MNPEQLEMAKTARNIFERNKVNLLVKGGENELEKAIELMVLVYPDAKKNRAPNPYTFEDFVNETSTMLTASIIGGALANTGRTASFMSAKP